MRRTPMIDDVDVDAPLPAPEPSLTTPDECRRRFEPDDSFAGGAVGRLLVAGSVRRAVGRALSVR